LALDNKDDALINPNDYVWARERDVRVAILGHNETLNVGKDFLFLYYIPSFNKNGGLVQGYDLYNGTMRQFEYFSRKKLIIGWNEAKQIAIDRDKAVILYEGSRNYE
jgi:hypothetical protein